MGLKEYVEQGLSVELNNGQTRLLSGKEHGYEFGNTPEELLTLSIENIENHFSLVGLVERFDESLLLMKKILGYEDIRYVSQILVRMVTAKQRFPQKLSPQLSITIPLILNCIIMPKKSFNS